MDLDRWDGECHQRAAGEKSREQRTAEYAVDHSAPQAALAVVSPKPAYKRNMQPIDAIAELG